MEVITHMLYCAKCHTLFEEGTNCSNCNEPLTEPKSGNLILLTAAMYAESNEILDAFRARRIYIDRQPAIEEGVFELFVQYEDWAKANETLELVLEDMKQHVPCEVNNADITVKTKKSALSRRKKWILRVVAAIAFGLVIWGVVALTDFAMIFVKEWFS